MARCQRVIDRYGKRCGAHILELRHYESGEIVLLDFIPNSSGEYIVTDLGFCGEVTADEKNALRAANVLYFTRHNCLARQTD